MNPQPQPTDLPPNGLLTVLRQKEMQNGFLTEASKQLAAAVIAAASTGKKASLGITLTIEPKQGALNFTTKVKTNIPVREDELCIFYTDGDGNLFRDNPRQKELQFGALPRAEEPAPATQQEAAAS